MLLACCCREPRKRKPQKSMKQKNTKIGRKKDSDIKCKISAPIVSTATKSIYSNNFGQVTQELLVQAQGEVKKNGPNYCPQNETASYEKFHNQNGAQLPAHVSNCQNMVPTKVATMELNKMLASSEDLEGSSITSFPQHQEDTSKTSSASSSGQLFATNRKNSCPFSDDEVQIKDEVQAGKTIEEYEEKIKSLQHHHMIALEQERKSFEQILHEHKETHIKELEKANIKARNEANETICKLNKQIVHERAKMFAEHQENNKNLEEEFKMKEERLNNSFNLLNQSLTLLEEREQAWQSEKSEVLREVQRLREEATKMAKIVALEYEAEEKMNETQKRGLSQEVLSLQLIVEMKTKEVRDLREQMLRASQQLDQAEINKEHLKKAFARVEDLEEQLRIKNVSERQLSAEKYQMEIDMTNTNKEVNKMKQNIESMQWRIRNNFDLPPDTATHVTSRHQHKHQIRTSLPAFDSNNKKGFTDSSSIRAKSTPLTEKNKLKEKVAVNKKVMTPPTTNLLDEIRVEVSPCSEGCNASITDDDQTIDTAKYYESEKGLSEEIVVSETVEKDGESYDEGVEDISSDQDNLNSPQSKTSTLQVKLRPTSEMNSNTRLSSQKERIPSRFSFGN